MPWAVRMTLLISVAGALLLLLVAWRLTKSVESVTGWKPKRVRLAAAALVLWIILYPALLFISYFFELRNLSTALQASNTLIDALLTYPFWIGIIITMQLAILLTAAGIIRLLLHPVYKGRQVTLSKAHAWIVIALSGAVMIYVLARVYNDTLTNRIREREVKIEGLPDDLDGFRIVHIADLQADGKTQGAKLQAYLDRVNSLDADLILFAGDLVTSGVDYIDMGAEALGRMQAKRGIYACLGDHDYFSDRGRVVSALQKNGVNVLENVSSVVPVGSSFISLMGVTWVYRTRPEMRRLEALEQQRIRGPVNILLAHQPAVELVDFASTNGYDIFAGGHTHGGQVVFPLPGFLLTGPSFETKYVTGFYELGRMLVSVNNGLGMTLAPVRYNAPAEVTLLVLRK